MKSSKRGSKAEAIREILTRGTVNVVERAHLERALRGRKVLRVKLGIDPTAPDLHLGHAVVLRKLRQFQDLGHKAVLIIGDFTGMIGDPSGRSKERKLLSEKEIKGNMKQYLSQAGKIIDIKKAEIRYNSQWLAQDVRNILELAKAGTVKQVVQREDFRARIDKGLTLLEALYPLLQGYDSVRVRADVELGGADQLLNLLMGRQIQRHFGMKEQDIVTVPLLEGTDGMRKMSKSYANYIGVSDAPSDMYGKVMSIPDSLIVKYFLLCTDMPEADVKGIEREMKSKTLNPRDAKMRLAWEIVKLYHGERAASSAAEEFARVFQRRELPKRVPQVSIPRSKLKGIDVLDLVTSVGEKHGVLRSRSEAWRKIEGGAVRLNGRKYTDPRAFLGDTIKNGDIVQIGKRQFFRLKISAQK